MTPFTPTYHKRPKMPMTEAQLEARDDKRLAEPEPERIWLQPKCEGLDSYGRCWSEEHPGDCLDEGCGLKAVKYIRCDLVEEMKHALERIRALGDAGSRSADGLAKDLWQCGEIATAALKD